MPNITKVSLLACALQIPGDPFDRVMGVLIAVDGERCISQIVRDVKACHELLRNPIHRPLFKTQGFDLFEEPVRWVERPLEDKQYLMACSIYRQRFDAAKKKVDTEASRILKAPHN